ncbi:auxin-responsive protein SAUR65-like [Miscanthus floridulus]|uniref:auxin-responsive protein SAUR65-like n=1 Tax=Miscanthus floridulus TaxID=154761 RepID=UPI003458051B
MAAPSKGATRKSLISRTLEQCKSGLSRIGTAGRARSTSPAVAGCFPVYVGPERVRFVVRAEYASHTLFRRLLDDAEREYGHAARGPLALPCDVDAFLDVPWHMEHGDGGGDEDEVRTAVSSSPICGLRSFSKNRAAGYRMMNPRSSPVVARIDHKLVEFMPADKQDYEEIIEEYEEEVLVQEGALEPFIADFVDPPPAHGKPQCITPIFE